MTYQTIIFKDNSNPYICKTKSEFNRMKSKYNLESTGTPNFWKASEKSWIDLGSCGTYYDWHIKE